MKVKELIELLEKCNQDADVTPLSCRYFEKHMYNPVCLDYYKVSDENILMQKNTSAKEADVVFVH